MEWVVNATPRLFYPRERHSVPIVQEDGWAPGPVWTAEENLAPTGIRSPDRPPQTEIYICFLCKYGIFVNTVQFIYTLISSLTVAVLSLAVQILMPVGRNFLPSVQAYG